MSLPFPPKTDLFAEPEQTPPKLTMRFPWQELKDYMSLQVSLMLCTQNLMVGEVMQQKDPAMVPPEQLASLRKQKAEMEMMLHSLNLHITKRIKDAEENAPRIILQ